MMTATQHTTPASERKFVAGDWCVGGYRAQTINPPVEALV
jgi:hypothetical protein